MKGIYSFLDTSQKMIIMKNEKELQQKYFHAQLLKQQASALMEEKQLIDARINEVGITTEAIKKIGDMKKSDVMWSPIGSGAFMVSSANDTENVLISVGAGVIIKTPRSHALGIVESRMKDLQHADLQVTGELNKFFQQISSIEHEMQEMVEVEQHKKEMKKEHKHDEKTKGTGG